jgi:hypothetical protein
MTDPVTAVTQTVDCAGVIDTTLTVIIMNVVPVTSAIHVIAAPSSKNAAAAKGRKDLQVPRGQRA